MMEESTTTNNNESVAAMNAAATAAIRGTYGVSKEGSPEAAAVMKECRQACQLFCMRKM